MSIRAPSFLSNARRDRLRPTREHTRVSILLCASLACAWLTACTPPQSTKKDAAMHAADQSPSEDFRGIDVYGAKPELVDPAKGVYRFSNGVCRSLDRIPHPWRTRMFSAGESPDDVAAYFEAPYPAFGIPVPPGPLDPIYDREKQFIDLALTDPRLGSGPETAMREALIDPQTRGRPTTVDIPYSPNFRPYTDNGLDVMFVNEELRAAVVCVGGIDQSLPNPFCHGSVLFDQHESAMFTVNYRALAKIDEIVRSIRHLATTLRAECPAPR